jgi:hypothetical protein
MHVLIGTTDLPWTPRAQVFFNGARLPIKGFQDYVGLYLRDPAAPRVYERVNARWEVCVCASEGQFQQVPLHGLALWLLLPHACAQCA